MLRLRACPSSRVGDPRRARHARAYPPDGLRRHRLPRRQDRLAFDGMQSKLGGVLDPVADRLYIFATLLRAHGLRGISRGGSSASSSAANSSSPSCSSSPAATVCASSRSTSSARPRPTSSMPLPLPPARRRRLGRLAQWARPIGWASRGGIALYWVAGLILPCSCAASTSRSRDAPMTLSPPRAARRVDDADHLDARPPSTWVCRSRRPACGRRSPPGHLSRSPALFLACLLVGLLLATAALTLCGGCPPSSRVRTDLIARIEQRRAEREDLEGDHLDRVRRSPVSNAPRSTTSSSAMWPTGSVCCGRRWRRSGQGTGPGGDPGQRTRRRRDDRGRPPGAPGISSPSSMRSGGGCRGDRRQRPTPLGPLGDPVRR